MVKITIHGDQQVFDAVVEAMLDWSPVTELLADSAAQEQRKHLAAAQGASGPFAPLSPAYAARKARLYPGKGILRAEDVLYDSVISTFGPFSANAGPLDDKARFHASGEPRTKIPLRDFIYVDDAWCNTAVELAADHVMGAAARVHA